MNPVLSPKDFGQAIGVSESSVKRWADEGLIRASRTAGGHRRIPVSEAFRFIRETRAPVVRPEILGLGDLEEFRKQPTSGESEIEKLYEYLTRGLEREARGLLLSQYLAGENLASILDGPIREVLHRIGDLWKHQDEGVFVEHRATDICIQAVTQLRLTLPEPTGPFAVGCAISDDVYMLPSLMVGTVLLSYGYQAVNLGPDTPIETLELAVREHDPEVVWISVSMWKDNDKLKKQVTQFAEKLNKQKRLLVVGGRERKRLKVPSLEHVIEADSLSELGAFLRGRAKQTKPGA